MGRNIRKGLLLLRVGGLSVFGMLLFLAVVETAHAQIGKPKPRLQTARVLITEQGYSRTSITLRRGIRVQITFLRQTDNTCATEVVIPAYGVHRGLPLN